MRRRAGAGAPVSFFSFQDVMVCVIGITIVITMILLIQVTEITTEATGGRRVSIEGGVPLDERERALRDRIAALEHAVRAASARPDTDPLARRASLRQELLASAAELDALSERTRELEAQLRELLVAHPEAAGLREVLELTQTRDRLAEELQRVERRKRITFIVDSAEPLRPIVFEVSASRIVVTDAENGAASRIAAGTHAAQALDALALFKVLAQERPSYILLVVTPSGLPLYETLLDAIAALPDAERPRLGLDFIPEGSFVSPVFPGVRADEAEDAP
ncbi:MAG: hypothetical protein GC172_06480 [Phycisphaera sp.]|nr:hypothetical protein [Phycisphaera sp.]